ncbi:MAG: hypothetical protein ACP5J4_01305 [Anaerolineae bacterium]
MVDLTQIRQVSAAERIRMIELILQSLKQDMRPNLVRDKPTTVPKPFKVRQFDLGQEVCVDRDKLYTANVGEVRARLLQAVLNGGGEHHG